MTEAAALPAPKKRGPNTPEGKARSAMNAVKHGLRAREFCLLPEEDPEEWTRHLLDLIDGYRPVDATEEKLVTAIAAAMWKEIRADRFEAEVLTDIAPRHAGRSHGSDLQPPDHAASLTTAIRYATAAGTATRRAQRAFLEHRKAKQEGLILTARHEHARTRARKRHERICPGSPRPSRRQRGQHERSRRAFGRARLVALAPRRQRRSARPRRARPNPTYPLGPARPSTAGPTLAARPPSRGIAPLVCRGRRDRALGAVAHGCYASRAR